MMPAMSDHRPRTDTLSLLKPLFLRIYIWLGRPSGADLLREFAALLAVGSFVSFIIFGSGIAAQTIILWRLSQ